MNKTLYIVTSNFPPTNIVGALRPYRIAKHAALNGWKVRIITKIPMRGYAMGHSLIQELSGDIRIYYIDSKTDLKKFNKICDIQRSMDMEIGMPLKEKRYYHLLYNRIKGTASEIISPRFITDLFYFNVLKMYQAIKTHINYKDKNIILTTSPPHSIHLAGVILKYKFDDIRWISDFRDPFDSYTYTGEYDLHSPIDKYLEKKIIKYSDCVVSTTNTGTTNLISRYSRVSDKFKTFTNTFDKRMMNYTCKKNRDKFVISYTGIFYPEKDPYTFFRALKTWFDRLDLASCSYYKSRLNIRLIGSKDKITLKLINDLGLSDIVEFINRVPHEEAIKMTLTSDMVLLSSGLGDKTRPGWIPSKLIEYLGCKVPILAIVREGEMTRIISECDAGYIISKEDHERIIDILKSSIDDKFSNTDQSNRFRFYGVERFEEQNVFNQYMDVIENLL